MCVFTECSVAGIATDYVGKLNKTMTNRTCLKWVTAHFIIFSRNVELRKNRGSL